MTSGSGPPPFIRFGPYVAEATAMRRATTALEYGWYFPDQATGVRLEAPVPWDSGPTGQAASDLHGWVLVDDLLEGYSWSGETVYLERASAIGIDWLDKGTGHDAAWSRETAGKRAHRLGYLVVATAAAQDGAHNRFVAAASHHLARFASVETPDVISAAGAAALSHWVGEDPSSLLATRERLCDAISRVFDGSGMPFDHAMERHVVTVSMLMSLLDSGLVVDEELSTRRLGLETSLATLSAPDGSLPGLGVSNRSPVSPAWTARGARLDGLERSVVSPRLLHRATKGRRGQPVTGGAGVSGDAGTAVLRSADDTDHIILTAGDTSPHADDLAVTWHRETGPVLHDPGHYEGAEPGMGAWMASASAHNTVELASDVQMGPGSINRWGEVNDALFCDASAALDGGSWRRSVVALPGQWLLVVDRIETAAEVHSTQRFHVHPRLEVVPHAAGHVLAAGGIRELRLTQLGRGLTHQPLIRAQIEPSPAGWWAPTRYRAAPSTVIGFEATGPTTYAALFSVATPTDGGLADDSVWWTEPGGTTTVSLLDWRLTALTRQEEVAAS